MAREITDSRLKSGRVIWVTGLSGSGKSTLSRELVQQLRMDGQTVISLDGDELRSVFRTSSNFMIEHNRNARMELAQKYALLCQSLAQQGVTVVIATISMFKEIHQWNRANLKGYFEVYLKVPIEELRRRDPKNIYKRYDAGEIQNVAGLDLKVDEPSEPDFLVQYHKNQTVSEVSLRILNKIKENLNGHKTSA